MDGSLLEAYAAGKVVRSTRVHILRKTKSFRGVLCGRASRCQNCIQTYEVFLGLLTDNYPTCQLYVDWGGGGGGVGFTFEIGLPTSGIGKYDSSYYG